MYWYHFKTAIRERLKQVYTDRQYKGDRVFNKLVIDNNVNYPFSRYAVQYIPANQKNIFRVEIDTYDNASDVSTLENFQDYLYGDLHRILVENANLWFVCYGVSIGDIIEDTEDLNRRRIILDFKVERVK